VLKKCQKLSLMLMLVIMGGCDDRIKTDGCETYGIIKYSPACGFETKQDVTEHNKAYTEDCLSD